MMVKGWKAASSFDRWSSEVHADVERILPRNNFTVICNMVETFIRNSRDGARVVFADGLFSWRINLEDENAGTVPLVPLPLCHLKNFEKVRHETTCLWRSIWGRTTFLKLPHWPHFRRMYPSVSDVHYHVRVNVSWQPESTSSGPSQRNIKRNKRTTNC